MAYVKENAPSKVYHLTKKENLDSILEDGRILCFGDSECWFCTDPQKMKAYMEQTVMCEGKPYHNLYAYEKGPDGKPRIIPEQAKVVKEIYAHYLRGDSLPMICRYLEAQHIPNIRGGTTWGHSAVRGILSNEKYVGDVLMKKTFRQDCISHKAIRNTGQRPIVQRFNSPQNKEKPQA